ncbi:hypothetical protein DAPPUDRAFT_302106 [Daphnia pulex]|uniref:Uncharacterized protein n=1 Tax=Daphnia pulex TaxID=6669 RepID=E9GBC2_DAPPU|nr:hypothetical protein DAPPUDRAFT_302106 [Daphnia pulex]|eukprot:EFX83184.1 hypothetical protein DAPPUDRAFT_302106 [Daphnia pulex]
MYHSPTSLRSEYSYWNVSATYTIPTMKLVLVIVLVSLLALSGSRASPLPQGRQQGIVVTTNNNAQQQSNSQLTSQVQNTNQGLAAALFSSTFASAQQVFQAVSRQLQGWSRL